jgi:hypothetical protein
MLGEADRVGKIKDGRRLIVGRQVEVKQLRAFPQELGAQRDGLRQDDVVIMAVVIIGPRSVRHQEAGAEESAGRTGRGAQKVASG